MTGRELSAAIHRRLCLGIKTAEDKEECLAIDEEWRNFYNTASTDELRDFNQHTVGLEAFAMIIEGLKYDADPEKYMEEARRRQALSQ